MYTICLGLFLICSFAILQSILCDETLFFPEEEDHETPCDPVGAGTLTGLCVPIDSCPAALQGISSGKAPIICSFKGKNPVVCCPKPEKTAAINEQTESPTTVKPNNDTSVDPPKPQVQTTRNKRPYLKFPGCGVRKINSSARLKVKRAAKSQKTLVAGGEPSVPFSWPWMVAIFSSVLSSRSRFHCGGSLISDQEILTAAHCFHGSKDPSKYYVVLQAHERSRGYVHRLSAIIVHENYTARTYYDDIAILRMTLPVRTGEEYHLTRPVCLPSPTLARKSMDGKQVVVTGWGDTSFGGSDSSVLREAVVSVVPRLRCNATYAALSKFRFPRGIDSRMLCAGTADGSKDACMGDSGGPLVLMDGVWTQVGIVSFGFRCAEPGFPGVYTRVSEYMDWIEKNTNIPKVIN